MNSNTFIADLEKHLAHLPENEKKDILADVRAFFADGLTPEDFGDPAEFAKQFEKSDDADDVSKPWYVPSFDIFTDPAATDRWWDPSNPHVFVRKSLGIGWDINLAALAVKAGIIRADDLDDDVLASVPAPLAIAIHRAPATLAAASLPAVVGLALRGKPGQAGLHGVGIALSTLFTRSTTPAGLIGKCLGTGINATLLTSSIAELADARGKAVDAAKLAALLSAPALALAAIKTGLARVGQEPTAKENS